MKNVFNTVFFKKPNRNFFDLSHDRKFSCDMGKLVPIHCQEVLPGDKISLQSTQLIHFAPLVSPVMHKIDVFTHFFFVPNRLLWFNWEDFITGGEDGKANPQFPTVNFYDQDDGMNQIGTIPDYLGLPANVQLANGVAISALPFAAYNLIWNEYYRDQNMQEKKDYKLNDGDNHSMLQATGVFNTPYERAWEHDYFTSCLPFPQKGDEVLLPLGTTAPIGYNFTAADKVNSTSAFSENSRYDVNFQGVIDQTQSNLSGTDNPANQETVPISIDNSANLNVDLSGATSSSINDLRRAFKLQEWLERNARGGSRYIENLLVHFGVKSSDARLQRPEYLGGGKSPVVVSQVVQTSESVDTPQGNMSGKATNVGQSHQFSRYFEEHGYIIGIMSVMPKTAYQQGIHKHWTKFDKLDYFWDSFANIGEQEVKNQELFVDGTSADAETFGYLPRYSEYRFLPNTVHGDFKDTLNYWHMGRDFANRPHLNEDFIKCMPTDRIFAVQDLPDAGNPDIPLKNWNKLYCHVYHQIKAVRPLPKYGTPSF